MTSGVPPRLPALPHGGLMGLVGSFYIVFSFFNLVLALRLDDRLRRGPLPSWLPPTGPHRSPLPDPINRRQRQALTRSLNNNGLAQCVTPPPYNCLAGLWHPPQVRWQRRHRHLYRRRSRWRGWPARGVRFGEAANPGPSASAASAPSRERSPARAPSSARRPDVGPGSSVLCLVAFALTRLVPLAGPMRLPCGPTLTPTCLAP